MTSYWASWRAAHPEYRQREAERGRARRMAGRGDRTAEYARQQVRRAEQRAVASGDSGLTETDHPLLALAREVAGRVIRPDRRSILYRPTFEDATAEAVLALVEGADAIVAVRRFLGEERQWAYRTAPLLDLVA
jgi:hypothetical protein